MRYKQLLLKNTHQRSPRFHEYSRHMMSTTRCTFLSFLLLWLFCPVICFCSDTIDINIVDYGIYASDIHEKLSSHDSPTGWVTIQKNVRLLSKTDVVPATLGIKFGFRYEIKGELDGKHVVILRKFKYPGLADRKSGKVFHETKLVQHGKVGHPSYIGYVFEQEWELVPGRWSFEISRDGNKLAERSFTVYKP